jgi:hypothetical protein
MEPRVRHWLTGLVAGLVAWALVQAPAQHARAVLEQARTAAAHADVSHGMSHGTHDHGKPAERHDRHQFMPACMACVLMTAPGLPGHTIMADGLIVRSASVEVAGEAVVASRQVPWAPQRARAPPAGSTI